MSRSFLGLVLGAVTLSGSAGITEQTGATSVQYTSRAGVVFRSLPENEAVTKAREALAADPRNISRIIDLGVAQSGVRQFREAIATFTRGLEIEPNNALLLRWRGHRYLSVREFDRAYADLTRGAEIDASIYGIWYHLGIVQYERGDFAAAAAGAATAGPDAAGCPSPGAAGPGQLLPAAPGAIGHRSTQGADSGTGSGPRFFWLPAHPTVLRRQGWRVNPKRVYRLYRLMDLQRPMRKKGRRGLKRPVPFAPTETQAPGQVWALDIIEDKLVSGRKVRLLNVLDICSRYGLGSLVEHSITGALAARHLAVLFLRYGAPRVLRRDQGPEFESRVFQKLLRTWRVQDEPVPKGQPFDNGHVESFHGSLRDELLDAELFHSLGEAQAKVEGWQHWYNGERPHQSLGYRTPRELWEADVPQGAPVSYGPQPPEGRLGMPSHAG